MFLLGVFPLIASSSGHGAPKQRIPTWDDSRGAVGLQDYLRNMTGHVLGIKSDGWDFAGPRLCSNLRSEAKLAVQEMDVMGMRANSGAFILRQRLGKRFPDTMINNAGAYHKLFGKRGSEVNTFMV